jgi:hypothetical protein
MPFNLQDILSTTTLVDTSTKSLLFGTVLELDDVSEPFQHFLKQFDEKKLIVTNPGKFLLYIYFLIFSYKK